MEKDLICGVIDMHLHSAPDIAPRKTNDLELAQAAAAAGMGGIMLKAHQGSSVERAFLVQQMVPNIRIFGSLVLNYPVGGLNPHAVDTYVRMGVKEVWMPTLSAQHHFDYQRANVSLEDRINFHTNHGGGALPPPSIKIKPGDPWPWSQNGHGISIFDEKGKILQDVWSILEILAPSEAILGTGHLSVPETHALVDAARQIGVKRILATHPEYMAPLSIEDQRTMARKGVFFERCLVCILPSTKSIGGALPFEAIANNIRSVGVESTVLGTDFGQAKNIHPVMAMRDYLQRLREAGFKDSEIETMAVKTPAALLGC
jgi:hypothetical protein